MTSTTTLSTRDRILRAAEDVVLTDGVACLTLEKAAARAGLSKGGVLYHFKTRHDLVAGMVERLAQRYEAAVVGRHGVPFARSFIEFCFVEPATDEEHRDERVGAALIAAVAAEPAQLAPLREAYARWQAEIEAGTADPVQATVARLAADGLWLCELFGIDAISPQLRVQVRQRLLDMVTDDARTDNARTDNAGTDNARTDNARTDDWVTEG